MKRRIFSVFFMFFALSLCFSQGNQTKKSNRDEALPIDKKVKIGKLDNGLTYYIRENKKPENRIQFQLVVNAGSILEDTNQLGLAHFVEHMAFNGTKYYAGNEMINELEKKGIIFGREINAYTSFDQTVYYVILPSDTAELIDMGFKILDGWAFGLSFDAKEIEKERGVITEEWRLGLGASERLRKATWPIILKNSLYAERLPIGTEKVIRTFKHETLKRYYTDWYHTKNMALILVGDFKAEEMEQKIKAYFDGYKALENPRKREIYSIPDNKEPLIAIATDKEETSTSFFFFWKQPKTKLNTLADYREKIAIDIMDDMLNGRLSEKSDKGDSPFLYAGAGYSPSFICRNIDAYIAYLMPKDNQISASFESVLTEIYRAAQHGFLPSEFERIKEDMLESFEKAAKEEDKTETTRFGASYADHFLEQNPIMSAKQKLKYLKEILSDLSLEEVNALMERCITDENFVLSLTAPQKEELKVPTEQELLKILSEVKSRAHEPYIDNFKEEPLMNDVLPEGKIVKIVENKEIGFTEYTLSNGVRFILKPTDFKNDEILIHSFSPGGSSIYPDSLYYTATLAADIVNASGLGEFNNSQLQKKLKGKNCNISPYIDENTEGLRGYSSPKDLETALQLNYLYFKEARKDQEAFDKVISSLKTQLKFIYSNPKAVFMKTLISSSYPEDKRDATIPTDEQVDAVRLDKLFEIYQDRFSDASDFTYFFVGNFGIDTTLPLIAKYLGSLPNINRKETWIDRSSPFAKGKVEKTVEKGIDKQGILAIVSESAYNWNPKDNLSTTILNNCLDITMTEIIREKLGGTYSPSVDLSTEKIPIAKVNFGFYIGCDPDKAEKLAKQALKVLKDYQKKGGDINTLNKVKEQLKRDREKRLKENSFWIGLFYGGYLLDVDINQVYQFNERVDEIQLSDLQSMASKYLNTKEYVKVILKNEPAPKK